MQLHATSYQFDAPLANGATSASRVVPTFSLDSGLLFERDASYFGRSFTQTLEPRAFYVRTPYRDQSYLPNYDSGVNSFNFATVFTENAFVGNDRISDTNLLTLGVTSRLLDPATGAEAVRLGIAQRLRFDDQRVSLPALGTTPVPGALPVTDRVSDLLVGASVNWVPQWTFDSTVQYNPKISAVRAGVHRRALQPGQLPHRQRRLSPPAQHQRADRRRLAVAASTTCGATRARTWAPGAARAAGATTAWAG